MSEVAISYIIITICQNQIKFNPHYHKQLPLLDVILGVVLFGSCLGIALSQFILFLEVILMNNLEQSIAVDYYAILGVTRQSTIP